MLSTTETMDLKISEEKTRREIVVEKHLSASKIRRVDKKEHKRDEKHFDNEETEIKEEEDISDKERRRKFDELKKQQIRREKNQKEY